MKNTVNSTLTSHEKARRLFTLLVWCIIPQDKITEANGWLAKHQEKFSVPLFNNEELTRIAYQLPFVRLAMQEHSEAMYNLGDMRMDSYVHRIQELLQQAELQPEDILLSEEKFTLMLNYPGYEAPPAYKKKWGAAIEKCETLPLQELLS